MKENLMGRKNGVYNQFFVNHLKKGSDGLHK